MNPDEIDYDKYYYLENVLVMILLSFKCFVENQKTESLVMLKYMLRITTEVPDHRISIALFHM